MEQTNEQLHAVTLDELEGMDFAAFSYQEQPDVPCYWSIQDDSTADWAVEKIGIERAELERIKALADEQINRIMEKVQAAERRCENGTAYLTSKLAEYFGNVPHKKTKTTESYRLLSGTLKMKLGGVDMKQDDDRLLEHLKATGNTDMIQITEKPRWGEYKKRLTIAGSTVIDTETGEVVEGVEVIEKPDRFVVEV